MKLRFLLGLLLIVGVSCAVLWLRHEWKIDSCLDNGGRWNYSLIVCEGGMSIRLSNQGTESIVFFSISNKTGSESRPALTSV